MRYSFCFILICAVLFSVNAAEKVVESTGMLSYQTTAEFQSQWIPVVKPSAGNERRFFPAKAPDGTSAMCAGRFGKNTIPTGWFMFGDGATGTGVLFDVSGAGEENAFTAQVDFLFHRQHKRPVERIDISLNVLSADQKTAYFVSFYTNSDIWNKNNFKMQQIDLNNLSKKPKLILWKTVDAKLEKGAWYRLKMTMVRMNTTPRSPVKLKFALYEIANKKSGGADGKCIAEAISKIMPNLGDKIKFAITEPALPPYVIFLNNTLWA